MASIINSRNIFIDSSNEKFGDAFTLNLGHHAISAGDGQAIKIGVTQFSMYNNTFTVNESNSNIRSLVSNSAGVIQAINSRIPANNYATCHDISKALATVLTNDILTYVRTQSNNNSITATFDSRNSTDVLPAKTDTFSQGLRQFEIRITFSQAHNISEFKLQTFEFDDSYLLLGTDKLDKEHDVVKNNMGLHLNSAITSVSTTELLLIGLYPMQLSTSPQVYLRCSEPNTNIEMSSYGGPLGTYAEQSLPSNILGVFSMAHQFTHFNSQKDEYFLNLSTKHLNNIRLSITDRRNRPIGRVFRSSSLTAAGIGHNQSENGNLNFTAVLRVDVIQVSIPRLLQTKQPDLNTRNQIINNLATF